MNLSEVHIDYSKYEGQSLIDLMFQKQRTLMNLYEVPDIDLDIPKDQQLIRAMTWSVVEELGEAIEVWDRMDGSKEMGEHLGDELADMTHFYLELLMMSGIDATRFIRLAPSGWVYRDSASLENDFKHFVVDLSLAVNTLKNRFWRKTNLKTEMITYRRRLEKTVPGFFYLLGCFNFDMQTWIDYYLRKNEVNLFRIRSKY
jgi:NTP pyrophosphatase (non-canonical NTP hydrolase)